MQSIADLLKKIDANARRQNEVPIEAAQSYPFLAMCQQQLCLVVFYYLVTGPPRERSSFPPRWLGAIPVDREEVLDFRHLQKDDLAYKVPGFEDDEEPVYVQTGPPRISYDDLIHKEEQLHEALRVLIPLFKEGSRGLHPASKSYLECLKELVPVPWRAYYLSIGQPFFIWLMRSSGGVLLIDPPPGAHADPVPFL